LITGTSLGLLYGLVASGYSLIWSTMSLLHFAQGELVTVGAFLALTLVGVPALGGQPVLVILLVAVGVALVGMTIERSVYQIGRASCRERV